jgi:hypothetical protein
MPSPVDLRIWILSRTLGWSGRRVASEVGVSQPTVVRTLDRLSKEPPTEQEINEFMNVTSTPPRGLPAIAGKIRPLRIQLPGGWIVVACAILVCLALAAVMAGLTVRLVSSPPPPAGQIACLRYAPDGSIAAIGALSHGACPAGEYAVTVVQNP